MTAEFSVCLSIHFSPWTVVSFLEGALKGRMRRERPTANIKLTLSYGMLIVSLLIVFVCQSRAVTDLVTTLTVGGSGDV